MSHTKTLITQIQGYIKNCADLNVQEKASVSVFGRRNPQFLVNCFLENNLYSLFITVKRADCVAQRLHNTGEGYPVPLCAVEVYEISLWAIDNPAYRGDSVVDFLEKITEVVRRFFYNNPPLDMKKTLKTIIQL